MDSNSEPIPTSRPPSGTPDARLRAAEGLLREAVYRSRAAQAAAGAFHFADDAPGRCGLGERAAVVLDSTPEGQRLFAQLYPTPPDDATLARLRDVLSAWVVEQDSRDRQRNHFLKAFRQRHGFDRTRYTPEQTAAFENGLAQLNAAEDEARRAAALRLV